MMSEKELEQLAVKLREAIYAKRLREEGLEMILLSFEEYKELYRYLYTLIIYQLPPSKGDSFMYYGTKVSWSPAIEPGQIKFTYDHTNKHLQYFF